MSNDERSDAEMSDKKTRRRIDELIEWFYKRHEDPAERMYFESREGGYTFSDGGPYDATNVFSEYFPEEADEVIETAVNEIESNGTMWARTSVGDSLIELESLIAGIPATQPDPVFAFGDDGLIHLAPPPDLKPITSNDVLLEELVTAKNDLIQALVGTNAYTFLLDAAQQYSQAFSDDQISISRLYARGVVLENAAQAVQRGVKADELPTLPHYVHFRLENVLKLHDTYIRSSDEGRRLLHAASAYDLQTEQTEELKAAAGQIVTAIANDSKLFGNDVKEQIASDVQEIGKRPHPKRSNQVGLSKLIALIRYVSTAILGEAVVASIPGEIAIAAGTDVVNAVWNFLSTNLLAIKDLAGLVGSNFPWIIRLVEIVEAPLRHSQSRRIEPNVQKQLTIAAQLHLLGFRASKSFNP